MFCVENGEGHSTEGVFMVLEGSGAYMDGLFFLKPVFMVRTVLCKELGSINGCTKNSSKGPHQSSHQ